MQVTYNWTDSTKILTEGVFHRKMQVTYNLMELPSRAHKDLSFKESKEYAYKTREQKTLSFKLERYSWVYPDEGE